MQMGYLAHPGIKAPCAEQRPCGAKHGEYRRQGGAEGDDRLTVLDQDKGKVGHNSEIEVDHAAHDEGTAQHPESGRCEHQVSWCCREQQADIAGRGQKDENAYDRRQ